MSKKSKTTSEPDTTSEAQTVPESPAPPAGPTLTVEQQKELGAAFLREQEATEKAEQLYEAARLRRSDAVKAIVEQFGHKGPYRIGGKLWSAKYRASTGLYSMTADSEAKTEL